MSDKQREAFESHWSKLMETMPKGVFGQADKIFMRGMWDSGIKWQAAQKEAEPLYVRVVSFSHGPGEEFVEIETAAGNSVRVASQSKGRGRLIGPLYTAPQPAKAAPEGCRSMVAILSAALLETCRQAPISDAEAIKIDGFGTYTIGDLLDQANDLLAAPQPGEGDNRSDDCPYPCGWQELNRIIIQKAAYFARATLDDEYPDSVRQAGIDLGKYARDLCSDRIPATDAKK